MNKFFRNDKCKDKRVKLFVESTYLVLKWFYEQNAFYNDLSSFLAMHFPCKEVQKILLMQILLVPNRDGSSDFGGYTY